MMLRLRLKKQKDEEICREISDSIDRKVRYDLLKEDYYNLIKKYNRARVELGELTLQRYTGNKYSIHRETKWDCLNPAITGTGDHSIDISIFSISITPKKEIESLVKEKNDELAKKNKTYFDLKKYENLLQKYSEVKSRLEKKREKKQYEETVLLMQKYSIVKYQYINKTGTLKIHLLEEEPFDDGDQYWENYSVIVTDITNNKNSYRLYVDGYFCILSKIIKDLINCKEINEIKDIATIKKHKATIILQWEKCVV